MCVLYLIQSCNTIITENEREKYVIIELSRFLTACAARNVINFYFPEFIRQIIENKRVEKEWVNSVENTKDYAYNRSKKK